MKRTLALLIMAAAALALVCSQDVSAQNPTAQQTAAPPTFPSNVEMVVVDVVVATKDGGPLPGLRAEDFTVTEDGVPQQLATFDSVDIAGEPLEEPATSKPLPKISVNTTLASMNRRSFVLVFDQVHLTSEGAKRARAAIADFLKHGPREGDTVMLVATGRSSWWMTRSEEDGEGLNEALEGLKGLVPATDDADRMTEWEAVRIHDFQDQITLLQVCLRFATYSTGKQPFPEDIVDPLGALASCKQIVPEQQIQKSAEEVYQRSLDRNRTTLDSLVRVADSLATVRGRKTVILFSEGFIRNTPLQEYNAAIRAAQRANVAIYFVNVHDLEPTTLGQTAQFGSVIKAAEFTAQVTENPLDSQGTAELADMTGGYSISNTNDIKRGLRRISLETRHYYLLGYSPTNLKRDGKWRKINVRVNQRDLMVHARKGYFAPVSGKANTAQASGAWRPGVQQAVDSPFEFNAIPLRATHHVFGEAKPGKARALVTAEMDVRGLDFAIDGGRSLDTLELLILVANRRTGEPYRHSQTLDLKLSPEARAALEQSWLPFSHEFELPSGDYLAKVVVREKKTGAIGSVHHEFNVPDLQRFFVSTPVLSDAVEPKTEGSPLQLVIRARRSFLLGVTLYYQFEVYGAAIDPASGMPRVSSGFSVCTSDGAPVVQGEPAPIRPTSDRRLARIGSLPLSTLVPGEYQLVLSFKDEISGRTLEDREPFTVEAPHDAVTVTTPGS